MNILHIRVLGKKQVAFGRQTHTILVCEGGIGSDDVEILHVRLDQRQDPTQFKRDQVISLPVNFLTVDGQLTYFARFDACAQAFLATQQFEGAST